MVIVLILVYRKFVFIDKIVEDDIFLGLFFLFYFLFYVECIYF